MKKFLTHITGAIIFFLVAENASGVCTADFQYTETSPLVVEFENLSYSFNEGTVHYYWDFGDGNTSYQVNPTHEYDAPGIYGISLTIITTDLCYDHKKRDIYIGIPATSPSCNLEIFFTTGNTTAPNFNNGFASVYAFSSDYPGYYYGFWSNGGEGESIDQLVPGTYCITLTNGENCYGTNCVTIGYNNNCIASFLIDSTTFSHLDGAYRFINNSHGEAKSYQWDFGDGTTSDNYNPLHVYSDVGTYNVCLTITTNYNCTHSFCKTLHVDYISPLTASIYGIVKAGDAFLPEGAAVLYEFVNEKYHAKDFVIFQNGLYCFDSLPKDVLYLTHIIPHFDIDEIYFPKYTATYFDNSYQWQQSSFINLYNDTIYHTQLHAFNDIYFNNGQISGTINYIDTISYEEQIFHINWFESSEFYSGVAGNIVVLLKNSHRELIDFRLSDSFGNYVFDNLEYGGYYLSVEKPGLTSDEIYIEISEDSNESGNNDFNILENTINPVKQHSQVIYTDLFPNPADDKFSVIATDQKTHLKIYSSSGLVIMEEQLKLGITEISVETFESGMYIVEISSEKVTEKVKLIKL
jgi:PKD repeat protein